MARRALDAGLRVLSDDLNALRVQAARTQVEKVPFAGDVANGAETLAPLATAALCRLRQGDGVRTTAMTPASALAALIAAAPFLNVDPYRGAVLERLLLAATASTPVLEVACHREATFEQVRASIATALAAPGA